MAIDFSDLGGTPIQGNGGGIDFSDLGGQRIDSAPQDNRTGLQKAADFSQKALDFIGNPGYAIRGEKPPVVNDMDAANPLTTIGNLADKAGNWVTDKVGKAFPKSPVPAAIAGMATSVLADPSVTTSTKNVLFQPQMDLPDSVALSREARTGVKSTDFKRLYKDPGALFTEGDTNEVGQQLSQAKKDAGINVGVQHNDLSSLTPENIQMARLPRAAGKDALTSIMDDIKAAKDLLPPGTPDEHAIALADISPDTVNKALTDSNNRLSKLVPGTPAYQSESAIKSNLQNLLQSVAPEVKAQNAAYARLKLRDNFQSMQGVNKNGMPSKLGVALNVAGAGVGAILGSHLGANSLEGTAIGGLVGKYGQQAYHAPYVAGLQTSLGGYANQAIEHYLAAIENRGAIPAAAYVAEHYKNQQ